jgi:NAD(P)-dependent dehydrogenase (short-subunit alcohol dehydrogenase family)
LLPDEQYGCDVAGADINLDGARRSAQKIKDLGRVGEPEEMVGPALCLAPDVSSMVTGIVLPVDGGFPARQGIAIHTISKEPQS